MLKFHWILSEKSVLEDFTLYALKDFNKCAISMCCETLLGIILIMKLFCQLYSSSQGYGRSSFVQNRFSVQQELFSHVVVSPAVLLEYLYIHREKDCSNIKIQVGYFPCWEIYKN